MQTLTSEAEMAIRKEDWPAINEAINNAVIRAVEPLIPQGWRKAIRFLRDIAPLGGILTLFLALIAIVITLGIAAVNRTSVEATFRGKTEEKLGGIERQLIDLRALTASSQPNRSQNQDAAKVLLAEARQKVIPPIPAPVIERAGMSFIEASKDDPKAWSVALEFASYRSSLNELSGPKIQDKDLSAITTDYSVAVPAGRESPVFRTSVPIVSPQDATRWDVINADKNIKLASQPYWLIGTGGAVSLDNYHIRHAALYGTEVHYSGGPVILEGVIFIDCTFVFDNVTNGRRLGQQLLAASSVNFRSVG